MSLITRTGAALDTSSAMYAPQLTLTAGAAIDAGAPCYLKSSDGKLYMSNGTAATEAAEFVGIAAASFASGAAATVFGLGARFCYDTAGGLTPGDKYFIAATAGRLDSAATTGGTVAIVRAVTAYDIVVIRASE
jgi:hypothetical protein